MLDGVLTLIAATDGEALIETAIATVRDELTSVGARIGQADWLAPRVITYPHFWGRFLRLQARVSRIVWKGFTPLSLAVSTVVRTSASARAAHIAR